MKLFTIKWDGMGFTSDKNLTEQDMTAEQAAAYTKKLRDAGQLPAGVHSILSGYVSPDGREDGEWKVFVCIELVVEGTSEDQVEASAPPDEFLLKVATEMVGQDAEEAYGVSGAFEALEVDTYQVPAEQEAG